MAEGKKKVIIYADWIDKFEALKDDEAGRLIKHFFRYINDLNPKYPDRITELSFIDIQNTLKRDLIKWEKRAENSRENGKNGGRPLNPKKPKETHQVILEPKEPVNDIVSVIDNVKDTVTVKDNVIIIKNDIVNRKLKFAHTLKPYLEKYGNDFLNDFYSYWTEPNKSNTKFKQELEKTWDLSRRLETWAKNDKNFNRNKNGKPSKIDAIIEGGNANRSAIQNGLLDGIK